MRYRRDFNGYYTFSATPNTLEPGPDLGLGHIGPGLGVRDFGGPSGGPSADMMLNFVCVI